MTSTAFRHERTTELRDLMTRADARAAIETTGTPLLLLDTDRVRAQYRRLRRALPFVRFHYAIKALAHPAVIDVIAEEGGCFDAASRHELALLRERGIAAERVIHTNPIKTTAEIAEAFDAGVRVFVVDNATELAKFVGFGDDVQLLVRLAYSNPAAVSDLSNKFGVDAEQAGRLVEQALAQGTRIAGFSFHVGSQLDDPGPFCTAVYETLMLMDALESRLPVRFDVLDIGGGIPVGYDDDVARIEEIADVMRPMLASRASELDIIAEPGRILVADSMTLVTSVVGVADRVDGRWYYLDDGVYGSYSNVASEHVHPLMVTRRELDGDRMLPEVVFAGPTCDSADVIVAGAYAPDLAVGDLVLSPTMGAYTAVTACEFNGRAMTPIVELATASTVSDRAPESVAVGRPAEPARVGDPERIVTS